MPSFCGSSSEFVSSLRRHPDVALVVTAKWSRLFSAQAAEAKAPRARDEVYGRERTTFKTGVGALGDGRRIRRGHVVGRGGVRLLLAAGGRPHRALPGAPAANGWTSRKY